MSHSQNNQKHTVAIQLPRRNRGPAYQNLPEEPPLSPSDSRSEQTIAEISAGISRLSEIAHESPAQTELKEAVNRFIDKCRTNQFYIMLIWLIEPLTEFLYQIYGDYELNQMIEGLCILGIVIVYFIDLIRTYRKAQMQREKVRTMYKIFEFVMVIAIFVLSPKDKPDFEGQTASHKLVAVFLLVSYLIKAVFAYTHNKSVRVNYVNNINKTVLTMRVFFLIEWVIQSFQKNNRDKISPYIAHLPLLGIMLIVLLFTIILLDQIFFAYRSQIWNSNSTKKTKGVIWIFGNLFPLIIYLLNAYIEYFGFSKESNSGFYTTIVIWCASSLILSRYAREGVLELFSELVNILEPSEYKNETDVPVVVARVSDTLFRPATELEVSEFAHDQDISREITGESDIEAHGRDSNHKIARCSKCHRKYARAIFMECGHGGLCFTCAKKRNRNLKECHLCPKKIKAVLAIDIKNGKGKLYKVVENIINREEQESS